MAMPALVLTRALAKRYPGVTALDELSVDVEPDITGPTCG
jgi:hypothetical protein